MENREIGIQEVNMCCIISAFTDNWKHRVTAVPYEIFGSVWPQYKSEQLQKKALPG